MRSEDKKRFTIGQFAAMHQVTKKTLMWYDEMGLLKPAMIGENGYRYYTYAQSSVLETILMLRELNGSLPEIKEFLSHRSAERMEQLLREKMSQVDRQIAQLKAIRQTLISRHQDLMTLLQMDLSEICIVEKKKKSYLAVVPLTNGTTEPEVTEDDIAAVMEESRKHHVHRLHDAVYGSMISVEALSQGRFDQYDALYIEVPSPASKRGLHVQPAGLYLRAFCKGSWDQLPRKYEELLAYANQQGLSLYGHSYETGINETVINHFEEYLTQIEIPIKTEALPEP